MMKQLRLMVMVLACSAAALPAQAAIIGLAGGDVDPQSIFDATPQPVDPGCVLVDDLPLGYDPFCAQYTIFDDDEFPEPTSFLLHSIDFRLQKPESGFYSTAFVGDCELSLCVDEEFSDLDQLIASPLFADGITFRLFSVPLTAEFILLSNHGISCDPFVPDCDAEFFSNHPSPGLSVVGVNGVVNPGVALAEPATLLLVVPAIAALARRRRAASRRAP